MPPLVSILVLIPVVHRGEESHRYPLSAPVPAQGCNHSQ
jgi:hypothetical protein